METLQHDSEWMTQQIAAQAVPNSRRFVAVHDKNGQLMLFSLGTDAKLYVSSLDASGNRVVLDLGLMLGFEDTYVGHAFAVVQDKSSKLYIAVAMASDIKDRMSSVYLLKPFEPGAVDLSSASTDLEPYIMAGSGRGTSKVFEIFMAPAVGQNYPPVIFSFKDEMFRSQDLSSLVVTKSGNDYSWTKKDDVRLPENAATILSLQPLVMKYGSKRIPGHAVLYEVDGQKAITFCSQNVPELYVALKEPSDSNTPDPQALAALQDADGYTDLFVGGAGLFQFKGQKLNSPESIKLTDAGVFSNVKQLQVSRSNSKATVWAASVNDGIGYMTADLAFRSSNPPVQLIPDHKGGTFAPFKATPTACESFVMADSNGNLSMLEQDETSAVWKTLQLIQPSLTKTIEVQAYMTQIKPLNSSGGQLINHPVILKASGEVSVIVNGQSLVATEKGVPVRTDHLGLVTITVPADDISTHTFTVTDASKMSTRSTPHSVDPGFKIYQRLSKIKHKEDLDIDLGPGKGKLLDHLDYEPEQIEGIANNIHEAMKSRHAITRGKPLKSKPLHDCGGYNAHKIIKHERGIVDMFWDAWHWLEKQAGKIVSFIVDGAKVLVQIGKTIYQWVIKTVDQIGKVLSVIFNKILELGEKLIQWLSFIFNWGDITATKDSIVNLVQDALEEGPNAIDSLKEKSTEFFESLKKKVSNDRPSDQELGELDITADDVTGSTGQSGNPAEDSMAINWTQYQFNHGGGRDAATYIDAVFSTSALSKKEHREIKDFDREIGSLNDRYHDQMKSRSTTIVKEYDPEGSRSLDAQSANEQTESSFLTKLIDGVEDVTSLLLNLVETILKAFKGTITTAINIPIFSAIYKKWISPGNDLTILDALALLIAIPTTIMAKIVTGKKPPTIERGRFAGILKKVTNGESVTDPEFNKFACMTGVCTFGICLVLTIPESLSGFSTEPNALHSELMIERAPPSRTLVSLTKVETFTSQGKVKFEHVKSVGLLIYKITSIPTNRDHPAFGLKIASWVVSVINNVCTITMQLISALADVVLKKVKAVIGAIFAAITFALSVTAHVIEINTPDWNGKNDTDSKIDIAACVFHLIANWSGALEKLIKGMEPTTELIAKITHWIAWGLGYGMTAIKILIHMINGDFSDLPIIGDML